MTFCITKSRIALGGRSNAMKKMGRPKGDNNKDYICTIRMDERTMKRLEAYCRFLKKAKSEVIRDAINMIVDEAEDRDDN